jgi:hypothetical protein
MNWRRIAARLDGPWTPARYWVLSACAVLALLCWLPHPYYGEEPVYAIITIETWWHGSWLNPVQLGAQYGRPPLLNWVVMLGVWLLGWDHILLAMRLIAFASTLGMAAMVAWFAHYLSRDRLLGALPFSAALGYTMTLWLPLQIGASVVLFPDPLGPSNPTSAPTEYPLTNSMKELSVLSTRRGQSSI